MMKNVQAVSVIYHGRKVGTLSMDHGVGSSDHFSN